MTTQRSDALQKGDQIDRYRIERMLGDGGFGITYLATQIHGNWKVAIKEYLPSMLAVRDGNTATVIPRSSRDVETYNKSLEKFFEEAQILSRFKEHPNIVTVNDVFKANGTAYLVMHYEEGQTLGKWLKDNPQPSQEQLLEIFIPLLDGLREIHAQDHLHRDIKPDNIFIRSDGRSMLIDFGAARDKIGKNRTHTQRTVTDGYSPHEQYDSNSILGAWTDLYAVGATMWSAINGGKDPVSALDRGIARINKESDPLVLAIEFGKGRYSEDFLKSIDLALEFLPKDRPQSVQKVQKQLLEETHANHSLESLLIENSSDRKKPVLKNQTYNGISTKNQLQNIRLNSHVLCNKGGRKQNQDYFINTRLDHLRQCIVLDGLGGQGGGQVASRIAAKMMLLDYSENMNSSVTPEDYFSMEWLAKKFELAHDHIKQEQTRKAELSHMATTVVALVIMGDKAIWGHVGNSRLYLFRNGQIYKQTHSGDPWTWDLQRALGDERGQIQACIQTEEQLYPGDVFLLCSDGFWKYVTEDEMLGSLYKTRSPKDWLQRMEQAYIRPHVEDERLNEGREKPENDNYTAFAVWYGDTPSRKNSVPERFVIQTTVIWKGLRNVFFSDDSKK